MVTFLDFVAIKPVRVSERTTDYKAMTSFINSVRGCPGLEMSELLRLWIVDMIDNGLTSGSRRRYIEKLSAIYREYCARNEVNDKPFDAIKELRDFESCTAVKDIHEQAEALDRVFDRLMSDARTRPELAVFLYMLFNASADMEKAISLTTAEYDRDFPQLDYIIKTDEFHHRRKYVFDLGQSRKRMPQLVREVTRSIRNYLCSTGVKFTDRFSGKTIAALWVAKAKEAGVKLSDLKTVLEVIPDEYEYLRFVNGAELSPEEIGRIKRSVAESFSPSCKRWYAIKLRRGVGYSAFQEYLKENFRECYDENTLFYPQKEIFKRVDKKIVTEEMPVIPNVVFVRVFPRHIKRIDALVKSEYMGWVFRIVNTPESDYSVISNKSMACFQHVIGVFTPDVKIELTREFPVSVGREVRITGGIMAGYTGTIYDVKEESDVRLVYVRLSQNYLVRAEVKVEEFFVEPLDRHPQTA